MQIVGYFILIFGVIGILLGLYGLFGSSLPHIRLRLPRPSLRLPKVRRGEDEVESLIAELEKAGYRGTPFEAAGAVTAPPGVTPVLVQRVEAAPEPAVVVRKLTSLEKVPGASQAATAELEAVAVLAPAFVPEAAETTGEQEAVVADETMAAAEPDESSELTDTGEDEAESEGEEDEEASIGEPSADDILSLFDEEVAASKVPQALREAISMDVAMTDLLAEARALRGMLSGANRQNPAA